jgi:DNA-binding transcriptional LysR family regulator
MHFDLADLRLFIHIAESPSLTQGAKRAFLSPAAASARIKALEGQLDTRLLYRDSRGDHPGGRTAAAPCAVDHAPGGLPQE